MSLTSLLPAPRQSTASASTASNNSKIGFSHHGEVQSDDDDDDNALEMAYKGRTATTVAASKSRIPPYGQRKGWVPKSQDDFGDGGAYPEIFVAQYPLGMGKKKTTQSNALAVKLDAAGRVQYDSVLGHSSHQIVHAHIDSILTKNLDDRPALPDEATIDATTAATKAALERIAQTKIAAAKPVQIAEKQAEATYVRYTPAQQGEGFNSGASQRIIKMVEMPKDPLEPSKFLTNKKLPKGPPSPPAPVMHSPPRKVTADEAAAWKVPPCVSNWVNPNGYTIPLDKRLAADGRGIQENEVNEKFAKFAEALYIADKKAREGVALRAEIRKKVVQKEKEKQEEQLRALAQKSRMERSGIVSSAPVSSAVSATANYASSDEEDEEEVEEKEVRGKSASSSRGRESEAESRGRDRDRDRDRETSKSSRDRARSDEDENHDEYSRRDSKSRSSSERDHGRDHRERTRERSRERDDDHRRSSSSSSSSHDRRSSSSSSASREEDASAKERDALRAQMKRDREHEARLAKNKHGRERERDVSEQIALGLPAINRNVTEDSLYDSRLLNHGGGFSATGLGDEDAVAIYDKPLFAAQSAAASQIYRPSKDLDSEIYGDAEVEALIKKSSDKFHADKEFSGTDRSVKRDGPVQFTKGETSGISESRSSTKRRLSESEEDHEGGAAGGEEDLFSGMNKFLTEAKKGSRSALDKIGSRGTLHAGSAGSGSTGSKDKRSINFESQKHTDDENSRAKKSRRDY